MTGTHPPSYFDHRNATQVLLPPEVLVQPLVAPSPPALSHTLYYGIVVGDAEGTTTTKGAFCTFQVPITSVNDMEYAVVKSSDFRQFVHFTKRVKDLKIRLVDRSQNPLDLRGLDWTMTIRRC